MTPMFRKLFCYFSLFISLSSAAQNLSSQIIDSETGLPIPFATVQTDEYHGVMTNEEGFFSLSIQGMRENKDSLTISSLGYKTLKIPLKKSLDKIIQLTPDIYEVIPVFIQTRNLSVDDIIDKVRENLTSNYDTGYQKCQLFERRNSLNNINKFDFTLKESTLKNINQKLLDDTFKQIPRRSVYLTESLSDAVTHGNKLGFYLPKKIMQIQSKEDVASSEKITQDFMKIMEESFKSDSKLILKTGIIRLDKTESIDSIMKDMESEIKKEKDTMQDKKYDKAISFDFKNLFIHKDSEIDVINKPGKYNFTKKGYALWGENWVYIIHFSPKGNAKFKGALYVDAENYAIVKAEFYNAHATYDKHFNMLGITANTLTFKNIVLFKKLNNKYALTYYLEENTNEAGINRPFTVIEKNDETKGKKRINRVEVQMNMLVRNSSKTEFVLDQREAIDKNNYTNFTQKTETNPKTNIVKLKAYDPIFWDGYNVLTPEKAIQELKIEE
jgi:hypothetical protein